MYEAGVSDTISNEAPRKNHGKDHLSPSANCEKSFDNKKPSDQLIQNI
jgi:hypothetical protein